jgi:hypothetical protein
MSDAKNATLQLPTDLVESIVKQQIHTTIATALADSSAFTKAVSEVLSMRVDSRGNLTTTTYDSQPFLQRTVSQAIAEATKQVINEEIESMKGQIRTLLMADLKRKNSPLLSTLIDAMCKALLDASNDKYRLTVNLAVKEK